MQPIITPEGWELVYGPIKSVPVITKRSGTLRSEEGCVTVGNRVMAYWQRFGHLLGNGTIVGFERNITSGWIKVVIDYDYPGETLRRLEDGYERWDYDRTCLCVGHYPGETQEESVSRQLKFIRQENLSG